MPDATLSDAIQEAYASAPTGLIIYDTLEIDHPTFTEPIRVVRDYADLTAYLEDDAPKNPGEEVTFVRYAFDVVKPELTTDGVASMQIVIDNVSRLIAASIEAALESTDYVTIIYREYISTDLTGPQNDPPIKLYVTAITVDAFKITATCGFPNLANRRFPTQEYSAEEFPGLVTT